MKGIVLLSLCLLISGLVRAQEYYRYLDDEGRTHMETSIPAEYVSNGYEVLNARGEVVRRVEPVSESEDQQRAANPDQAQRDGVLLSSYSSVEEIEAHRQRRLDAISREVRMLEFDHRVMSQELSALLEQREDLRASGREVPANISEQIPRVRASVESLEEQRARREREIQAIQADFDERVARFVELTRQSEAREP